MKPLTREETKEKLEEQLAPEGDGILSKEQVRIWDKELPSFFSPDVIDPQYELETYGLSVAEAQREYSRAIDEARGYERGKREERERIKACIHFDEEKRVFVVDMIKVFYPESLKGK